MQAVCTFLLIVAASAACVRSHATACDDKVCAEDTVCVIYTPTNDTFCAPAGETECQGKPDGTLCDDDHGTCYGGGCFPVGCGNGVIDDPVFAHPEACDDGNRKSHDGCSSSCTTEVATWTVEAPGPVPTLFRHAMAYDVARDSVVVFGGDRGGVQDETWLRRGSDWELVRQAAGAPSARSSGAMAYDGVHRRIVMFGGVNRSGGVIAETWEWDGTRWTSRLPVHSPPPRAGHAMAFDTIRGRVVLYGGKGVGDVVLRDTWTWDGTDWTEVAASGPPPMTEHAMVFDPVRGEIVMVGETGGVTTWRFDGGTWSLAATSGPPHGTAITLAFDPATSSVLWIGDTGGVLVQWQWDGARWFTRPVSALPRSGADAAAVTDATGPFVYGGHVDTVGDVSSQYSWDGTAWREPPPVPFPAGRQEMALALDTRRRRLQVVGGLFGSATRSSEVWELAGAKWILDSTAFPLTAGAPNASFDEALGTTMVVWPAGSASWNGAAWSIDQTFTNVLSPRLAYVPGAGVAMMASVDEAPRPLKVAAYLREGGRWSTVGDGPDPRREHSIGFDRGSGRVILFGGVSATLNHFVGFDAGLDDTWAWDHVTRAWTALSPLVSPPARTGASLVWDAAREHLVLVGGLNSAGSTATEVWTWDGKRESWQPVLVAGTTPERSLDGTPSAAVPAPDGDGVVVVKALQFGAIFGLTVFRLRWLGPGPLEDCRGTLDLDRDGKAGCEDPDCAVTCALAAQTCSDTVCDATESTASCPADCPARAWCGDFTCASGETPETCPGDCGMPSAP